jgi:hypothetical protein
VAFKYVSKFSVISGPVTDVITTDDWLGILGSATPVLERVELWMGFCTIKCGRKLEVEKVLCAVERARYIYLRDNDQRWTIAKEESQKGLDGVIVKCLGCYNCPDPNDLIQ